jgi:fructokinase
MILCCGEALIDMLPRRTMARERAFVPTPGGAVFNTAIALARLGVPAGFFSRLSSDMFGGMLRDALGAAGVDTGLALTCDSPTTLAFVQLENGEARYSFHDENTAGRLLSTADLPALPDNVDALFFGGLSLMTEPCGAAYETLMARESAARVTMIDPNIRPAHIEDGPTYRARLGRLFALADIVKLSDADLRWIEGDGDISDLAHGLLARGPSLVFVTEGARGARVLGAGEELFLPAPRAEVVDTIGAGDTFNAGVLAALHAEGRLNKSALAGIGKDAMAMATALALGIRAAAVTVSRAGANPPMAEDLA